MFLPIVQFSLLKKDLKKTGKTIKNKRLHIKDTKPKPAV